MKTANAIFLLGMALAALSTSAGEFVVARRGEAPLCALLVPTNASASQKYAAKELGEYVRRLTGTCLADSAGAKRRIRIESEERRDLGEDGYEIFQEGDELIIRGSRARGCLYGVYELLERFGGVRWYSSWHEKVPALRAMTVPEGVRIVEAPAFAMRRIHWYDVNHSQVFATRLRMNSLGDCPTNFCGRSFRFGGGLGNCHTFETLVPVRTYGASHPEYFSMCGGRRRTETKDGHDDTQLCLTNPEVLRLVTEGVLARIRQDPDACFYGVSQNDNKHYCQCEKCSAVNAEEDSPAGTVVRFVNAVAEAVEREFPHALIETLAYQGTRRPPKATRLRPNVIPCLCTIELDFSRPIPESRHAQNRAFLSDITGWSAQTDELYVWDYVTDFRHYLLPYANVHTLQGNVRFFRDNGVKMLIEQGAREGLHAGFAELKTWLLAKLMWNPDADFETLRDDFLNGYYGPAAPAVKEYLDDLHRQQRIAAEDPSRRMGIGQGVDVPPYADAAFLSRSDARWRQALNLVAGNDRYEYNVRMSELSHRYVKIERMRLVRTDEELRDDPEAKALALGIVRDVESALGPVAIREWWSQEKCLAPYRKIAGDRTTFPKREQTPKMKGKSS